ncbi:MAG: head-tail connector protein [Desulfovibrio sp.]|nr:head-tail connector protein [Desulfovibrio sp.]
MKKFDDVRAFASHLESARTPREKEWLELARWICPYRGLFSGEDLAQRGTRRNKNAFLSTTTQALLRAASGITSGMTPRNISWFKPDFDESEMVETSGARVWLDEVDRRMKSVLADGGFYQAIQAFNTDLLWAGCALLYSEMSPVSVLRFECVQVGTFCIALDADGRLDAVTRTMAWTPARMAQQFGRDALSEGTKQKLEKNPYDVIRVTHCVRRRDLRDPGKLDKKNMPWESFFWEEGGEDFIHEGGFNEMPYFFAAWHEGQTLYGTGPGDEALPDSRQVDFLEHNKMERLGQMIRPPLQVTSRLKDNIRLEPGSINYVEQNALLTPIYDMGPIAQSMPHLMEELNNLGLRLEKELMATIFASMPLDQRPKDMSATEFLERKREALQQLGPVISAYEPNVLTPLLERTAATLDRAALLPPPPTALQGYPLLLKMEFVSPMANALRQTGAETTRALLQDVAMLAQLNPEILDKIDLDQAVDELATGLGVPGKIIRADADVAQIRQQRAQQQAAMQEQAFLAQQAQTAATAAKGVADMASAAQSVTDTVQGEQQ